MLHFYTLQKRRGFALSKEQYSNQAIANKINVELMSKGYVMSKELFDVVATQSTETLSEIYSDITKGFQKMFGGEGYEPIYRNFPQSVANMSKEEFVINAILHYWTFGTWRPEDEGYLQREFSIEPVNYKELSLLSWADCMGILLELVYSGSSLSEFEKEIIIFFLDRGYPIDYEDITFKETRAIVGKEMLMRGIMPNIRSANELLRLYSAFCGGDEGLKENTRFKSPSTSLKGKMLSCLDNCYDLEESFKVEREKWLRLLFYLNPMTKVNRAKYPNVARYTELLRNDPKSLRTFASYVEEAIKNKDENIFNLLKRRKGVFMRRMNQLFEIFGVKAVEKFIDSNPSFEQLVTLYNYFDGRRNERERSTVLASKSVSNVASYGALKAIDEKVVNDVQAMLGAAMAKGLRSRNPNGKKIYVDRKLYFRPMPLNNRAASASMQNISCGSSMQLDGEKTVRAYVHWVGGSDIDLSAFALHKNGRVTKVGWNGEHRLDGAIVYSGDNTGHSAKNAEYLDVNVKKLRELGYQWVVLDAKVYRGTTFNLWQGEGVHAGFMLREKPEQNNHWLPETVEQAMKISSNSKSAYLFAIDVENACVVFLDVAKTDEGSITSDADARKIVEFTKSVYMQDNGSEISWNKLGQGHILNLLYGYVVENAEDADIVFDENTPWERVSKILTSEFLL